MEKSQKVMELEICTPSLEKSWKLEIFVWLIGNSWNFRFFPKLFLAVMVEKYRNLGNFVTSMKTFNQWGFPPFSPLLQICQPTLFLILRS